MGSAHISQRSPAGWAGRVDAIRRSTASADALFPALLFPALLVPALLFPALPAGCLPVPGVAVMPCSVPVPRNSCACISQRVRGGGDGHGGNPVAEQQREGIKMQRLVLQTGPGLPDVEVA